MKKTMLLILLGLLSLNSIAQTERLRIVKANIQINNINVEKINVDINSSLIDWDDNDITFANMILSYIPNSMHKITNTEGYVGFKRTYIYENRYVFVNRYNFGTDNNLSETIYFIIDSADENRTLRLDCIPYD